jgi:hypothetical protein
MRGEVDPQARMFSYFSPESRVPLDHPLRSIKAHTDRVLCELSEQFDALYSQIGRPSIPPERLLKGQLLIALYSALGSPFLPDARLQHPVSLVSGHEPGGFRA